MASDYAVRAATAPELAKFRDADGDASILHLAFLHPVVVYTARINQSFTGLTSVVEFTYDGGSGTLASVLPGMSIAIGSTAGARDIGLYRVRKTPTATVFYINQSPNKKFTNDQYITIYDDFRPWTKEIYTNGTDIIRMDYDIELNDVNYGAALLRVAPEIGALFRDPITGQVTFTPPSPALSACYDGTTISSYLYAFPGSVSSGNLTSGTGTAYAVYDTAGEYRWSVTAIDSLGRPTTTYRRVLVDPTAVPFELTDCSGSKDEWWSFSITCHDDVTKAEVLEGALCVLYSEDWYNGVKGSIGKIISYENIVAIGRIGGKESIEFDSEDGSVSFTAYTVNYLLSKLRGSPIELTHTTSAPTTWKQVEDMTVDNALAHVLIWTTTLPLFMDCFLTGSTVQQNIFAQPEGSISDQLSFIAGKIFAGTQNNNLGQMYIQIDPQMMSATDRAALTVVMDITDADSEDGRNIDRNPVGGLSQIEISAAVSYDSIAPQLVYSRAIGDIYGDSQSYDDYSVADQDECNYLSGRILAVRNNEYDNPEISMPSNNRLLDVCPPMLVTLTFAEAERGITFSAQSAIPRRVKIVYDVDAGAIGAESEFEIVVTSNDGDTYYPPPVADIETDDFEYGLDFGGVKFPDGDLGSWFPDSVLPALPSAPCSSQYNSFSVAWSRHELRGDGTADERISKLYFPCKVRPKSYNFVSVSKVVLGVTEFGDAAGNYTLYGVKAGARVVTADANFEFDPAVPVEVDGFELELTAGLGAGAEYSPLDVVATGSVPVNTSVANTEAVTIGQYYCAEGTGGPWFDAAAHNPTSPSYYFQVRQNAVGTGGIGYSTPLGAMLLVLSTFGLFAEAIDVHYARVYFKPTEATIGFWISDSTYADNSGTMGYILRNAEVRGRRITLGTAAIKNICPV